MKKITVLCFALLSCIFLSAQNDSLLKWQMQAKKTGKGLYELVAKTTIPAGWHLYGNNPSIDGLSSVSFSFEYENAKPVKSVEFGSVPETITDPVWENKNVNVYTGEAEVKQSVEISGFIPANLKVIVTAYIGKGKDQFISEEHSYNIGLEGGVAMAVV